MDHHVVLVTGGLRGIGHAIADYLHSKGYKVYATTRNLPEAHNFPFEILALDVNNANSVTACISAVVENEGRIDVLVNNAGFGVVGPLENCSTKDLIRQFETNFFGVHRMVEAVLPVMKAQKGGTIVNMGSFGGRLAIPFQTLYSTSKAALAMYSDGLRMELFSSGINVSLVEPGDTKTDFDEGRTNGERYDPQNNPVAERALDIMRKAEQNGANPQKIAKTVHKIIRRKRPKPRYTTGIDAKLFSILLRIFPYSLQERFIMMNYKVPRG